MSDTGKRLVAPPHPPVPPHRLALFLDIDGTLAPITERPELTRIPLETRRILLELRRRGVAMAALSGRPLPQVRRLLYPLSIPAAGSHGSQLSLAAGRNIRGSPEVPDGLLRLLHDGVTALPGVWLESKPAAFAIHWRQAPAYRSEARQLVRAALELAPGWDLLEGHCVHELRPRGRNKGVALRRLMRHPGFAGRWPLAIGDDRTDEDAFRAALALGGGAIRIGQAAATAAPWVLPDAPSLAIWLRGQLGVPRFSGRKRNRSDKGRGIWTSVKGW